MLFLVRHHLVSVFDCVKLFIPLPSCLLGRFLCCFFLGKSLKPCIRLGIVCIWYVRVPERGLSGMIRRTGRKTLEAVGRMLEQQVSDKIAESKYTSFFSGRACQKKRRGRLYVCASNTIQVTVERTCEKP